MNARHLSLAPALVLTVFAAASCGDPPPSKTPTNVAATPANPPPPPVPGEVHFKNVRQLTFGGENAEAYWSFDGSQLIMQRRTDDVGCDRIYRMPVTAAAVASAAPQLFPVSSGKGATTCSYFLPGDEEVIYASTHLGGDACPPKPDHSLGYVWALYDTYDIFKAKADGSGLTRLTDTKGYDAEATVCAKDGSIIFTSTRDGDIDLYRMDKDGKNVKRLTSTPGYDGGAFFSADCSKIVWRASRPKPGPELDDFKKLLGQGLVRPSKLELYVANADGSEPVQLTYLNAASFAPFWHPSQKRILFSSNYGDPKGREFDIWAVNVDGTNLERITHAKGFDGFPMFSPDGKQLVFASNRATPEGKHDTNVFLADWDEATPVATDSAADRVGKDIAWLADPAREGRGIGTKGLEASGAYIEERFKALGLTPGVDGGYRDSLSVATALKVKEGSTVTLDGKPVAAADMAIAGFSPRASKVKAQVVFADFGVVAKELSVDEYGKKNVKGKAVLVRRFVPAGAPFDKPEMQRRYGDLRRKAWAAKEKGAVALLVVDDPVAPKDAPKDWKAPTEAKLPGLEPEGFGDVGIPVVFLSRAVGAPLVQKTQKGSATFEANLGLEETLSPVFNVVGRLEAPADKKLEGVVVIGAHYDHLGHGGKNSLAPGNSDAHVGADDNASGTAALLEVAKVLAAKKGSLRRDVLFAAFSGEESGVLGSSHMVRRIGTTKGATQPDLKGKVYAMLNMDMVGRMRANHVDVLGTDTAAEWTPLLAAACAESRVECSGSGDGYGPSDQMPFYSAGAPVLHFFTGAHSDYHKPTDTADRINAGGAAQTGQIVAKLGEGLATREGKLDYKAGVSGPAPRGDMRSFNASLGTIPDYAGPGPGKKGVLLSGVRPGSGADKGGLQRGDILVKLGPHEVGSVEDLMFVLNGAKPGETVTAVVLRADKEVKLQVTFQESGGKR